MLPYPVQQPVEHFEISPRFRHMLECRIERLESDAAGDEVCAALLDNPDHMRRHLRLVDVQRAEAMRMRVFLERAQTRLPRPLIAL